MQEPLQLKKGDSAPEFVTEDVFGNEVRLSDFQGKKVLISFFRYAGCPWCNLAMHRLAEEYPKLKKKGLEVIAFIQSSKEEVMKNIVDRHNPVPPFTLIADKERKIYEQYGVFDSKAAAIKSVTIIPEWVLAQLKPGSKQGSVDGSLFLVPADFLIDKKGKIYKAHYGTNYMDQLPFITIYDFLLFGSDEEIL